MSDLVPSEIIEKLEQRHERLIEELDELNDRLEQALNSFARPSGDGKDKHNLASKPNQVLASHPAALEPTLQIEASAQ